MLSRGTLDAMPQFRNRDGRDLKFVAGTVGALSSLGF